MTKMRIKLEVELTDQQAYDVAQFLKRCGWHEYRGNAVNEDEAYRMRDALGLIESELNRLGFAPR